MGAGWSGLARVPKSDRSIYTCGNMLVLAAFVAIAMADDVPFHYSGPMSKLLTAGAKVAPVTTGIPFEVVIQKDGSVGPASFKLSGQGWKGSANLQLQNLKYADGTLSAGANLENAAGTSLQGLRLDVVGATETYKGKDKDGKEVTLARAQAHQFESPLFFGDLLNKESEGPHPFSVSGLKIAPETVQITVRGVLSGLRYLDRFEAPGGGGFNHMDFLPGGKLVAGVYGTQILLVDPAKDAKETYTVEGQSVGGAVDPRTGDVYTTTVSSSTITVFDPQGKKKSTLGEANGIDKFVQTLRFDKAGTLYALGDGGANVFVLKNGKVIKSIEDVGGQPFAISSFDVAPNGALWMTDSTASLLTVGPDGKGRKVAQKADWKFGAVQSPLGIRVDRNGLVYVGEEEVDNYDPFDRMSVFDPQGRIVRIFGRAGKKPAGQEDQLNPGQLESPREFAFGPDGTLYVSASGGILIFQPF
jgi:sugar lactone lactonase YvrE